MLFADLKGSMELLADRDPEEARKLLDPVLERMMEAVHRYEGTVNQVMGDGIMALFGAPLAHEDHAVRACYAALRMQESVKRYAEGVFRSFGVPIQIRVGLNSGDVVVRAIGSDLHMDYTAVGQSTHLAARMEQMAQPGTILLTPETLALAEGFVQVTSRGPVPVKGLTAPIEIFELTGASPVRSRLHAAASRGLTRFVGRDAEIELLRQALERAGEGHGQVVAVVGEPGVGKSRLVWEFTHSHRSRGWLVLEAASVSYGKATTYFPVIELLARLLRDRAARRRPEDAREGDGQAPVAGSRAGADAAGVPVAARRAGRGPRVDALDPPQRRRQTLEALKRLLLRESQVQPVLLVVEDLHWIDTETQAWLDILVESLPTARLLLLVNYRPEYRHGWGSKTYYQQVRLDPLPPASAEELLEALLGDGPEPRSSQRLLIERTEGNPFFLEESVRTLVETRALTGERGAYRLAGPIQTPSAAGHGAGGPGRAHRPARSRRQAAAADGGRHRQGGAVPAAAGHRRGARGRRSHRSPALQAAEFLYETRLFPELEYTFKHALTHEVAYGSLLQERRRALHARLVEALERTPRRPARRAGRTAGPPCRAGRGVGQGRDLLPAGRRQGPRPRRVPRGGGPLRAGPPGPRAPARARRHQGAGPRSPPRVGTPAELTGRVWAAPRPVGRGRGPGPGARRPGPAGTGAGQMAWYSGRRETPTAPLQRASRPSRSRPRSATAPCRGKHPITWGRHTMPSATSAGRPSCCGGAWRRRTGSLARPVQTGRSSPRRGWRGPWARSGPSPRAGVTGRRRSASPRWKAEGGHRSLRPRLPRPPVPRPRGPGARHPGVRPGPGPLSCLRQPAWLRPIAAGLGYASALQGRLAEGRALLEEGISESIRTGCAVNHAPIVAWLSEVCRLAGHGEEAWQHARQALDLARQQKDAGTRRSRCTSLASSRPTPTPPMSSRPKPTTSRPWLWPRHSACARSWPTATSASASSTGAPASASRRRSTSPPRRRCTARWTCGSGWSRRRSKLRQFA